MKKALLAYDGSNFSEGAFKFAQRLLVYSGEDKRSIPDEDNIEELASQHFNTIKFFKLEFDPKNHLNLWASANTGSIIVCGSYGHSSISQLLHKSFTVDIIAEHRLPVFIAHL